MPLEIRYNRDGSWRDKWYGAYMHNGRRHATNLQIPIRGKPPASRSLKDLGDAAFEESRIRAMTALEKIVEEAHRIGGEARLVERLYELKTGESIRTVPLDELPAAWEKIPRRRPLNKGYAHQCKSVLIRFAKFIRQQNPQATEFAHITRKLAQDFMEAETGRGVSPKTWNDALKLLRAACKHLLPPGSINPFHSIPTRETETVFRHPFTPDELNLILEAAKGDEFSGPLIVTGICTAMRRGDCCSLRWKDVDLAKRFITVKTAKTGQTVSIPIFPMLYDLLAHRPRTQSEFVFPAQARMYAENPHGITQRVRKVFAAAGFRDADTEDGKAALAKKPDGKKATAIRGAIHATRPTGLRRASVRDFHSFRVTWVTLALTAGVPVEIVRRVTGHATADIVLKHYFQPGREEFRATIQNAMPQMLSRGAEQSFADKILAITDGAKPETWMADAGELRKIALQMKAEENKAA